MRPIIGEQAVLKLIITGGNRGREYRPPQDLQPTRILLRHPWPHHPAAWTEQGIRMRICDMHVGHNRQLAGLKHLNRLEQVLARAEWTDADNIQEGLMVDEEGAVIEGTMTNVFAWLPQGVLATPSLRLAGVAGVMRRYILEHAEQAAIPVRVATLSLPELMQAAESSACNSIIGVWPVSIIGHWKFAVGSVTRQVQAWAAVR